MMIHWCELCNKRPAEGFLEVIRTGDTKTSLMLACKKCVEGLDESDWITQNDQC